MLRNLARLVLLLALTLIASGEAAALSIAHAGQNGFAGQKLASGFFGEAAAILRQLADSQTAQPQRENFADGYDFAPASPLAAESTAARTLAPRALTQADLGIKGTLQELRGTLSVADGVATARIDMLRGNISNPFQIMGNLSNTARATGASVLRVESTVANESLYNILVRRYGMTTQGATDVITVPLR